MDARFDDKTPREATHSQDHVPLLSVGQRGEEVTIQIEELTPAWTRKAKRCSLNRIFLLIVLCAVLYAFTTQSRLYPFSNTPSCSDPWASLEAFECHHMQAQKKMQALLARQSTTVEEAVRTYKQRYRRSPPQGFENWARYALARNTTIIDDYDQLDADLSVLRGIPTQTLHARMRSVVGLGLIRLAKIQNGTVSVGTREAGQAYAPAESVERMIAPFASRLPDLEFLVNWDDRHRVYGPSEKITNTNHHIAKYLTAEPEDAWTMLTKACPHTTTANSLVSSDRPTVDICKSEFAKHKHGTFNSYVNYINTTVPMVSMGKFSTFQDIVAPTWCYADDGYRVNPGDIVPSFEDKNSTLYWRGTVTGLHPSRLDTWYRNHRARIVYNLTRMSRYLQKHSDEKALEVERSMKLGSLTNAQRASLNRLPQHAFDVGFSSMNIFEEEERLKDPVKHELIEALFDKVQAYSSSFAFHHKFLLDIDGNSMSCRFYRLMGSGGVVFKQVNWVEWHDDRLVPFYHYLPIGLDAAEVPTYMDMMTNSKRGRKIARTIAEKGKEWTQTALSKSDMSVAYYRLLLELANIYRTQSDV